MSQTRKGPRPQYKREADKLKSALGVLTFSLATSFSLAACQGVVEEASEFRPRTDQFTAQYLSSIFSFRFEVDPAATTKLDVLIVVDDSGSMDAEQSNVSAGIPQLISQLRAVGPTLDYRVAVTTSHPCYVVNTTVGDLGTRGTPSYTTNGTNNCAAGWTVGEFWGDVGSGGVYGDPIQNPSGLSFFQRDDYASDAAEDAGFQNAIDSLTIVGAGEELGIYAAKWVVQNGVEGSSAISNPVPAVSADPGSGSGPFVVSNTSYQTKNGSTGFFRTDAKWAFIFVSDEDECSDGDGTGAYDRAPDGTLCTGQAAELFSAVRDAYGDSPSDAAIRTRVSAWGILNLGNRTRYNEVITAFDSAANTNTFPGDADGHVLNITSNATQYGNFLSNVGSILANESFELSGASSGDIPNGDADDIQVFIGGTEFAAETYRITDYDEVITFSATPSSGTFDIDNWPCGTGPYTINFDDEVGDVEAALEAQAGCENTVEVLGRIGSPFNTLVLQYTGSLRGTDHPDITVNDGSLGGATATRSAFTCDDTGIGNASGVSRYCLSTSPMEVFLNDGMVGEASGGDVVVRWANLGDATRLTKTFAVSRPADESSIEVQVNGTAVTSFTYDEDQAVIDLSSAGLAGGDVIQIDYKPEVSGGAE